MKLELSNFVVRWAISNASIDLQTVVDEQLFAGQLFVRHLIATKILRGDSRQSAGHMYPPTG